MLSVISGTRTSASAGVSPAGACVRHSRISRQTFPWSASRQSRSSLPRSDSLGSRTGAGSSGCSAATYRSGSARSACRAFGSALSRTLPTSRDACRVDRPWSRIDRAAGSWLPRGNRVSSRAMLPDSRPRRISSCRSSSSASTRRSRRHTQDLCRPRRVPIRTCGIRSTRCRDRTTQASSRSLTPREGRLHASTAACASASSRDSNRARISASPRSSAIRTRLKPSTRTSFPASTPSETRTGECIPSRCTDSRRRRSATGSVRRSSPYRWSREDNFTDFSTIAPPQGGARSHTSPLPYRENGVRSGLWTYPRRTPPRQPRPQQQHVASTCRSAAATAAARASSVALPLVPGREVASLP